MIQSKKPLLKKLKFRLIFRYFVDCEMFDLRYGITTARHIDKKNLEIDSDNLPAGIGYVSSWPSTFARALDFLPSSYDYGSELTFLDFGSGMGKVCFLADIELSKRYKNKLRIIGIEYSPILHQRAMQNLYEMIARDKLKNAIEFENLDCEEFDYSMLSKDLIVFMYNPFDDTVIKSVFAKLSAKNVWVIYVNPVHVASLLQIGYKTIAYVSAWHPNAEFAVLKNS